MNSLCLFLQASESSSWQQENQPISIKDRGWDLGRAISILQHFMHLRHLLKDAFPRQAGISPRQQCPPRFGKGIELHE